MTNGQMSEVHISTDSSSSSGSVKRNLASSCMTIPWRTRGIAGALAVSIHVVTSAGSQQGCKQTPTQCAIAM
jgi:hypothetical protein